MSRRYAVKTECPFSRIGVIASSAGNSEPSARRAGTSIALAQHGAFAGRQEMGQARGRWPSRRADGAMRSATFMPSAWDRLWPNVFSAAGFHSMIRPSWSIVMMQSMADSKIAPLRASLSRRVRHGLRQLLGALLHADFQFVVRPPQRLVRPAALGLVTVQQPGVRPGQDGQDGDDQDDVDGEPERRVIVSPV